MKSFKNFLNESKNNFLATFKDHNSERVDVEIKGLKRSMKLNNINKEYIDDGYDEFISQEIYSSLIKIFNKNFKTKLKNIDNQPIKYLSPKKITIQF